MDTNYTIAEYVTLPSEGKVYTEQINPQIKLKSMTTAQEMRRLSPSDRQYQNLCSIIDDCIVEGPNLSVYNMCLGDYQFLLYKLRIITYGEMYKGQARCPYCGSSNEANFSMELLDIKRYSEDIEKYREFTLPNTGHTVKIKMRTPHMLDVTQQKLKEFKTKNTSVDATIMYSIESIIEEIDGAKPNPALLQEWIKELPMRDTNTITNYSDKLDSAIGVDTRIMYTCDTCGLPFTSSLKTNNEFFRPTLDIG